MLGSDHDCLLILKSMEIHSPNSIRKHLLFPNYYNPFCSLEYKACNSILKILLKLDHEANDFSKLRNNKLQNKKSKVKFER